MFSLVGGYIKVCIQLFNDTTFNIFLVEIYLSDISDGPDSKTGTAIRACSPQRLLLFDVMKKVALVHRVVIFQAMEEKSVSQKFMERKYLYFLSFFLTWSKSLWFVGTNSTLKYAWCLKGTKSLWWWGHFSILLLQWGTTWGEVYAFRYSCLALIYLDLSTSLILSLF